MKTLTSCLHLWWGRLSVKCLLTDCFLKLPSIQAGDLCRQTCFLFQFIFSRDLNLYSEHCKALSDMTHMSAAHFSPPTQQFPSPPRPSCPHCPCRDHQWPETGYITISDSCLHNPLFSFRMWILETWKIFMLNVILEWDGWSLEMSCSVRVRGCAAWLRLSPLAFNGMLSYQVLERTRASYLTLHRGRSHWASTRFYIRGQLKIIWIEYINCLLSTFKWMLLKYTYRRYWIE